jgi:hypothetical protein
VIYDTIYGGTSQTLIAARSFFDIEGKSTISNEVTQIVKSLEWVSEVASKVALNIATFNGVDPNTNLAFNGLLQTAFPQVRGAIRTTNPLPPKSLAIQQTIKDVPLNTLEKRYKEEVELDEVKMADLPSTKVQGRSYGSSRPEPHALDVMKGPTEKQLLGVQAEKKKKKFSEMVNLYQEKGLKSLSEMLVKEEPDNEQFTKELEDAKAKSEGKKRNTEIAKGAVQAVKQEELDINDINGVQMSTIEERHMTDGEMDKREKIVKSMKKGMAGFKDRYGDRAKNVMYATANKQAMKD